MFKNTYKNKNVLVTGHTGFKGSWLTTWLIKLGANVTGLSNGIPTSPSMFEEINLTNKINDIRLDVKDLDSVKKVVNICKPDFIFHLAAQAIVSKSYSDPVDTVTTNVIGTMNILESLRFYDNSCTVIMITSDKCYENLVPSGQVIFQKSCKLDTGETPTSLANKIHKLEHKYFPEVINELLK